MGLAMICFAVGRLPIRWPEDKQRVNFAPPLEATPGLRGAPAPAQRPDARPSLVMLAEAGTPPPRPPNLLASLKPAQREIVLNRGIRKVFGRGRALFRQGEQHD